MESMERHELSALWGDMPDEQFQELKEAIALAWPMQANGATGVEVRYYEDKVLDGWHRYRACEELGLLPLLVEYTGDDPAGFVIKNNGLRRHMTAESRASAIIACHGWAGVGRPSKRRRWDVPTFGAAPSLEAGGCRLPRHEWRSGGDRGTGGGPGKRRGCEGDTRRRRCRGGGGDSGGGGGTA